MFKNKNQNQSLEQFDTLIGQGTHVIGDIKITESLRIDGQLSGNIVSLDGHEPAVAVGLHGQILGNVKAARVILSGTIKGSIYATGKVEILNGASIEGDVIYGALYVEDGAILRGNFHHIDSYKKMDSEKITEKVIESAKQKRSAD